MLPRSGDVPLSVLLAKIELRRLTVTLLNELSKRSPPFRPAARLATMVELVKFIAALAPPLIL